MMNRRDFLKLGSLSPIGLIPLPSDTRLQAVSIQQMIDDAAAAGQTLVTIPPGTYTITQTIQCKYNVSLDLSGVTLVAGENVDIIHAAHRANITGGFIDCSQITFTSAALVLDGADKFDLTFPTFFSNIRMLGNWQSGADTGTGILLKSYSGFIQGVVFDKIGMSYFRNGIKFQTTPSGAWANGNQFSNLVFMICRTAIHLDTNAGGNTFANIQYQPDNACTRALYCEGGANMFTNFFVWDWPPDRPAIEFTQTAMRNFIITDLYREYLLDNGWMNKYINPDTP